MFRSMRWTLQIWHALLLLVVVCVFGAVLYLELRHARLAAVDNELLATAEVVSARLKPPFGPMRREGMREMRDGRDGRGGPNGPPNGGPPPPDGGRSGFEPPPRDGRREGAGFGGGFDPMDVNSPRVVEFEKRFELPENVLFRFEGDERGTPYYAIWLSNGELLRTSRPGMKIPSPPARAAHAEPPPVYRQRKDFREVIVPTGGMAMQVLVGRSIQKELAELRRLLLWLGATGAGVMVIGLIGGWLLSGRVLRPIERITATAQSISASNLSRRIDVADTQSELGTLAIVLNAMFGRLESAFEQQVRFTADASHELRTPLSVIYSHAELALARERSAPEYRAALEACFRASKRMKGLVESLLVLARADAGKLEIKQEEFDLAETAQDCVDLVRPLAVEKKVELKLDARPIRIRGDMFRMAQVITNLVSNAIHYNREGGSVSVAVGANGEGAVLTIADTGVGIAPEDQKHLFERFYRVDKARSRALGGSGLGLAISRSIIEAHGGRISFTSRINEGTVFEIHLPGKGV